MPVVSFACVAVLAPTLDRALGVLWGEDANALVFLILLASYSVGAHAPPRRSLARDARGGCVAGGAGGVVGRRRGLRVPACCWSAFRGCRVAACAAYRVQAARLRELRIPA